MHNLKDIDVDIPLNRIVGIAGVSGSGKSSLALGILYAEGSRRYLESLSTYTRRRMTGAAAADVDEALYVPAALALRQRPSVPGIRSTFGTGTELLNSLRLMFSRLGEHPCPNGHLVPPTLSVAAEREIFCPICGAAVSPPGAEELSFNSTGACPRCGGTGTVRVVDESTLVPDDSLTIDEGAVAPWQTLMWSLMKDIAREMGVRTDVPFRDLTDREKDIVFHGPAVKKNIIYQNKTSGAAGDMDFTYFNATYTVENALSKVKDEKGMKRVEKFLRTSVCPDCGGTRLSERARASRLRGISLDEACRMTLSDLVEWVRGVPGSLPAEMRPMAESICESFLHSARRLADLGLSYLTLDREASTLSTGERQRMQLARAVRNRTTGVLYVLDEPTIGLHPANIEGVVGVMEDLVADGNSVVLVDHDAEILSRADWIVELGPGAGKDGGTVIAEGTVGEIRANKASKIGPFLSEKPARPARGRASAGEMFSIGRIRLETSAIHTVKPLSADFPKGRLIAVTGVSGSGKTTMVLESLVPGLERAIAGEELPAHVKMVDAGGITQVKLIDATPIGINVRSTVATYADVHDALRKAYAKTEDAIERGYRAGDFSYNTGRLRCPACDGTGSISLDVQFLPDVVIPCPECHGSRYGKEAYKIRRPAKNMGRAHSLQAGGARAVSASAGKTPSIASRDAMPSKQAGGTPAGEMPAYSLPELMDMSVEEAISACSDMPIVKKRLEVLKDLGLSYLTLGEETPSLSGGEAQRLKLASEMGRGQDASLFVFDEPTIGLHPLDVRTLLGVFDSLTESGATVIVIEHDLDVIRNADYVIDMGPGGGEMGGEIVACGTPEEIAECKKSVTGRFI